MGASAPAEAVHHIHTITAHAYRAGIIQREHDGPRPPLVTAQQVRFNGVGDGGHQTFRFCTAPEATFACCKTARKPYDAVVMRVLLVLGYYRERLVIRSDGTFREEWAEALAWFNREVGRAFIDERLGFWRPTHVHQRLRPLRRTPCEPGWPLQARTLRIASSTATRISASRHSVTPVSLCVPALRGRFTIKPRAVFHRYASVSFNCSCMILITGSLTPYCVGWYIGSSSSPNNAYTKKPARLESIPRL